MTKLSANWTGKSRWLMGMPAATVFACFVVYSIHEKGDGLSPMYAFLTWVAIVSLYSLLMRLHCRNIVDELYDGGDFLLVRNGGIEDRIPLTQIDRVHKAMYSQPPRVTIRLNRPGKFGETIVYSPETRFALVPWAQNATNDLIERIKRSIRATSSDPIRHGALIGNRRNQQGGTPVTSVRPNDGVSR